MKLKYLLWTVFGIAAVSIGLYPLIYYLVDMHGKGLFSGKSAELLADRIWHTAFYMHITFGGIAMLIGWTQFSRNIRNTRLSLHRTLGKIYVFSVMLSSIAGFYIAQFASGGNISRVGFSFLAISWFFSVTKAYATILKKHFKQHENWMIRNYALTFAAVTLRIYLPFCTQLMHWDFITSYQAISWLCWVPNLIVAEIIISRRALIPAFVTGPKTTDYFQD